MEVLFEKDTACFLLLRGQIHESYHKYMGEAHPSDNDPRICYSRNAFLNLNQHFEPKGSETALGDFIELIRLQD